MGYKRSVTALPASADVVIIGAGFAGAATAWALGRRGVTNVVVLEREVQPGRFASGRSAGLGRQISEDDHTTALTVRGAALLRELPVWAPTGGLLSFDDPEQANAYAERAKRFQVSAELGGPERIAARWPQFPELRSVRTLWVPGDGTIDVPALLATYTSKIRVEIACPVTRIEMTPGPSVVTARGAIAARVVVDATGAWAGTVTGGEGVSSFKRHVFIMDADIPHPDSTPWLWHIGAGEMYLRLDAHGVLASPCDSAPSAAGHQDPDLVGEAHLRRLLDEVDSILAGAPITRRWACQRSFADDRKMRLGRDSARPWLVWAVGLGGHGATASPAVGERVASAVIEALGG
jgi:glycine/D-amino acid oxidase-like deaminating enzyme